MARQYSAALLLVPHHGRSRNHLYCRITSRRHPFVEETSFSDTVGVVGADGDGPVSVYCEHGWLDDGGNRETTVDRIRLNAHCARLFAHCVGRQRTLHV